ncbi:hypothetical protein [Aeromonas veronii]|uniref:hypothetical protein n=1 Tax=Aeromonas veronii TaxID=654 RepID=UPI0038D32007
MKDNKRGFESIYIIVAVIVFFVGVFTGAAWLAGKSALDTIEAAGSLATALTLVFLFYQHVQLKERQDKQEDKQADMWREQNEIILFQKYQTHRNEFFSFIGVIEDRYRGVFVFKNKNKLYCRLFPQNSFAKIQFNYGKEILCYDNPYLSFEDEINTYVRAAKILAQDSILSDENRGEVYNAVYELDLCTCKLLNLFELECVLSPKLGYVHYGDFVVMNGLSPFEYIGRLISIINELRQFANMKPYFGSGSIGFYSEITVSKKVVSYYLSNGFREIADSDLILILFEMDDLISFLRNSELFDFVLSYIKPLDFLGHMALENVFNSDAQKIINEIHDRFSRFVLSCEEQLSRCVLEKERLTKFMFNLEGIKRKLV